MLKSISDSISLADNREKVLLGLLFVVNLLGALLEASSIGFVYTFLRAVMEPDTLGGVAELQLIYDWLAFNDRYKFFAVMTLLVMSIFLVRILVQFIGGWMMLSVRKRVQLRVASVLFSGYMRAPYSRHLSSRSSVLMNNVTANTAAAVAQCTLGVVEIAGSTALAAVFFATLLVVKPLETLISALTLAVLATAYWISMHERLLVWGRRMMRATEHVYSAVAETAMAIKTIKVNRVESAFEDRFKSLVEEQMVLLVKNGLAQNTPRLVLELIIIMGVFGVMLSVFLASETITTIIPAMALFGLAALRMVPAFVRIIAALQLYRNSMPCLDAILPDYRQYIAQSITRQPLAGATSRAELATSIAIEDLRFSYAGSDTPALNGVSIEIFKGQLVGFAGPSGSGKSTTVDIMLGLLEATQGLVLIDGRPYLSGVEESGAGMFAYVPQDPVILDDTIRNNIAFGVPPDAIDDDKVWGVLRDAALFAKVEAMTDRLDSTLGERGDTLSGGERQRLGIARALYLNASVIVLDEPTASLDASTEFEVTEAIRQLRGSKTIIVIAHRLSSIAHCDTIFYFENGRVVGQGTFEYLMRAVPAFQAMVAHLNCEVIPRPPTSLGETSVGRPNNNLRMPLQ